MDSPKKTRPIVRINAMTQAQLIRLLWDGTMTCQELAEESGLHYVTVLQYTKAMHKAGAVHIARYDPDVRGRHIIKVYKLGPGNDARRIRMTSAQTSARYRNKQRMAQQLGLIGGSPCQAI